MINLMKLAALTNKNNTSEIIERAKGSHSLTGKFIINLKKVIKNKGNE